MSCPAFTTGEGFLSGVLTNIDCQAATLGTSGFAALSDPSSGVIMALTALLTLFIALFGLRLMLGRQMGADDVIGDVIRIGIVLTLATSWPAWRIVGYDVVMKAPQELAGSVGQASGLAVTSNRSFIARLQNADDGIIAMTMAGSGRLTGGVAAGTDLGDSPTGVALADQTGLGFGRTTYLIGTIAPLAIVRLAGGILIAIAPLMAGLLLFAGTSGVFFGWLRALGAAALGNLALILVYGVEMAAIEPWLRDVLAQRSSDILTPSAPGELLVISLAFAIVAFAVLAITSRIAFFGVAGLPALRLPNRGQSERERSSHVPHAPIAAPRHAGHAGQVSEAVARAVIREAQVIGGESSAPDRRAGSTAPKSGTDEQARAPSLGSSWRRTGSRPSAAAAQRDGRG